MADIRQAARWMQEGKKVKRSLWEQGYVKADGARTIDEDGKPTRFWLPELLADDWELAD